MTTVIQDSLPAPLRAHSTVDAPPARGASSPRVVTSIGAWVLAGFLGLSLVASSIARMFDANDAPGAEIVLASIVAGSMLVWIAVRRLIALADDGRYAASGQREPQ